MTYWYPSGVLRYRIGRLIDVYYLGYVELQDIETGEYVITKIDKCEYIK